MISPEEIAAAKAVGDAAGHVAIIGAAVLEHGKAMRESVIELQQSLHKISELCAELAKIHNEKPRA